MIFFAFNFQSVKMDNLPYLLVSTLDTILSATSFETLAQIF